MKPDDRKPYHDDPAYWQMVEDRTERVFSQLDAEAKAAGRKRWLIIGAILFGLFLFGQIFGPI